jgi:hypothetical protein
MSNRLAPLAALVGPLALLTVACSDDSGGDDDASVDPTACNTSLEVVETADAGGEDGRFGAVVILADGGPGVDDEAMQFALAGFEMADDSVPTDDPEAPDGANVLLFSLAAPEGGFADGQTFTDGEEAADGEITAATLYRGSEQIEIDSLTVTLGEITDPTVCGAVEASGAGVVGEFKAERVGAEQPDATTAD